MGSSETGGKSKRKDGDHTHQPPLSPGLQGLRDMVVTRTEDFMLASTQVQILKLTCSDADHWRLMRAGVTSKSDHPAR